MLLTRDWGEKRRRKERKMGKLGQHLGKRSSGVLEHGGATIVNIVCI